MNIETKGRQAIAALVDVAVNGRTGPVTLVEVAQRLEVSPSYLEQLFGKLRRAGLVDSVRGPGGGYRLMRPVATVTTLEIVHAVDPPRRPTTGRLWTGLDSVVDGYLRSITLAQLIAER